MSILALILVLIIIGVFLWGVGQMPFIDAGIKRVIYIIVVVCVVIWLTSVLFGVNSSALWEI